VTLNRQTDIVIVSVCFFYSSASPDRLVKPHSQKEINMSAITSFIKRHPQITFWSIAITSFFVSVFLSDVGLWGLLIYGTFLGGALVTGVVDGRSGLKTYFGRIVRWRVGLKWYAVALFLPLVLNLTAFGINIASGAALPTNPQWPTWTAILGAFFWPSLLGIALAEEPGVRGFSLPSFLALLY